MASETWSAILSGCPSVTDSEVNKKRSLKFGFLPIQGFSVGACRDGRFALRMSRHGEGENSLLHRGRHACTRGLRRQVRSSMLIAPSIRRQRVAVNRDYFGVRSEEHTSELQSRQ